MVGLEIKREFLVGHLSSWSRAALPAAGAVGGMLVPAAINDALNCGTPAASGWGTPMATDIAFVLGAMKLLSGRVPRVLAVFLVSLAIVDGSLHQNRVIQGSLCRNYLQQEPVFRSDLLSAISFEYVRQTGSCS